MNRIDSLLLLHRRLDGDHDDEQTATSTMPAASVVDAADSPLDSASTLNSVLEEDEDEEHHFHRHEEGRCSEVDGDSDLVVGFPPVPRRSSEALQEEEDSDDETTNTGPVSRRRSSLRPSSSCSSSQHKAVRFVLPHEDPVAIHYIESVLDMSPQEISKLWITSTERAEINRRNKETVKSMRRSHSENDLNYLGQSSRGLEHLQSSRILRALAQSQRDLIDAVLHLQAVQRKNSSFHPYRHEQNEAFARDLALLARQMSQSARARAIETAEADAATAALIAAMDVQETQGEDGQATSTGTGAGAGPTNNDRRRRHSDVTHLPSIPQERPSPDLPTIGSASAGRTPTSTSNHAAMRQAYLANLQETLELGVFDNAGDNQSVASTVHGATSVGSQDSPLCF